MERTNVINFSNFICYSLELMKFPTNFSFIMSMIEFLSHGDKFLRALSKMEQWSLTWLNPFESYSAVSYAWCIASLSYSTPCYLLLVTWDGTTSLCSLRLVGTYIYPSFSTSFVLIPINTYLLSFFRVSTCSLAYFKLSATLAYQYQFS